jgi:hypothetical protein
VPSWRPEWQAASVRDLAKIGIYGGIGSPGLLTGATCRSAARSRPGLLSAGSELLNLVRNRERAAQNCPICAQPRAETV